MPCSQDCDRCDKYGRDIARSELNYEFYDVENSLD